MKVFPWQKLLYHHWVVWITRNYIPVTHINGTHCFVAHTFCRPDKKGWTPYGRLSCKQASLITFFYNNFRYFEKFCLKYIISFEIFSSQATFHGQHFEYISVRHRATWTFPHFENGSDATDFLFVCLFVCLFFMLSRIETRALLSVREQILAQL